MQSEASTVFLRLTMTELIQAFFFFKKEKKKRIFLPPPKLSECSGTASQNKCTALFFFFLIPILSVVMFPLQNEVLISFD